MLTDFESRVLRQVHERIAEDMQKIRVDFGALINPESAAASGMNCAKAVGRIAGLELALKHMREVHEELTGKAKPKSPSKEFPA